MERVPEPEIMGAEEEAQVYALADFSEVNQQFAKRVVDLVGEPRGIMVDLGCGPGDILARIWTLAPRFSLVGLDGSAAMLAVAIEQMRRMGLHQTIDFVQGDAKRLTFPANTFEVVLSNSLVHHLADPFPFWREVHRVIKPGGIILIRDLFRPPDAETAWEIVEKYSGNEPQLLKDLFFHSLQASFTVAEVSEQVARAGLKGLEVKMCSDRHWEVSGAIEK